MRRGKIGVFDSGLGGLLVFRSFVKELPRYDYIYLGDTKRVPYGNRSHETVYEFLEEAVDFLFSRGCELIIVACNTASAVALRKIQQEYVPRRHHGKKVLGVLIPAAEASKDAKRVGVLATQATVESGAFVRELHKLNPQAKVYQQAAPLLVPLIEQNKAKESIPFLKEYLRPLLAGKIDTLILGCTHYGILEDEIKKLVRPGVVIVSQNNLLPNKLRAYLSRHQEIERKLSRSGRRQLLVTDVNKYYSALALRWFGGKNKLRLVALKRRAG